MPENNPEQLELQPGFLNIYTEGKDELNLAEFPIASVGTRINSDVNTLVYEDEITDQKTGKVLPRRLTITGSDQYGLPVAFDDEVILGLVNLSKLQGFQSREVTFSRYQIIQILGWNHDDYYYRRIKESINRWLGVTLYYENAWRDKGTQKWVSDGFHLIDNVTWNDGTGQASVTWNKLIYRSFQNGSLKGLDLGIYRQLSKPLARRLYRFLDKRFFHGSTFTFDLKQFALNKLGISKTYGDIGQIKRALKPAIEQLEEAKFLHPLPDSERFTKVKRGQWNVTFRRFSQAALDQFELNIEHSDVADKLSSINRSELQNYGVSQKQAEALIKAYAVPHIAERIAWLKWRLKNDQNAAKIENIAGYLVNSIKSADFKPPIGFKSVEKLAQEAQKRQKAAQMGLMRQKRHQRAILAQEGKLKEANKEAKLYFAALPQSEKEKIRKRALSALPVANPKLQEAAVIAEVQTVLANSKPRS